MEKTVIIGGKAVRMRASALIPRLYRFKFGRDIIRDLNQLKKSYDKAERLPEDATEDEKREAQLSVLDLTIFENIAWLFARHAGEDIPDTPDEWLDTIDGVFDIYSVMPTILELWQANTATTSQPRKK